MKIIYLNKSVCYLIFGLILLSCATPPEKRPPKEIIPESQLPLHILREKALDLEKTGAHYTALQLWKSLNLYRPEDAEANQKITELRTIINENADDHFKKGLAYYRHKSNRDARKAFLVALYHNPEHQEALDYLKNKLPKDDYALYQTNEGDTLTSIAKRHYQDPGKRFLITYYNDLGKDGQFSPGTVLKLPVLDVSTPKQPRRPQEKVAKKKLKEKAGPEPSPPEKPSPEPLTSPDEIMKGMQTPPETSPPHEETPSREAPPESERIAAVTRDYEIESKKKEQQLEKARKLFESEQYDEAVSAAEEILEQDGENIDAMALVNASYYQMGKKTSKAKDYETAIKYYSLVAPDYKDTAQLKTNIEIKLSESHYLQGVKYFLKEEIEKAIHEWEVTLALNPDHTKARLDLQQAKKIMKKMEEIE